MKADLSDASIKDLFTIKNNILFQLENIEKRIITNPRISQTNSLGYKEQVDFKLNELD